MSGNGRLLEVLNSLYLCLVDAGWPLQEK